MEHTHTHRHTGYEMKNKRDPDIKILHLHFCPGSACQIMDQWQGCKWNPGSQALRSNWQCHSFASSSVLQHLIVRSGSSVVLSAARKHKTPVFPRRDSVWQHSLVESIPFSVPSGEYPLINNLSLHMVVMQTLNHFILLILYTKDTWVKRLLSFQKINYNIQDTGPGRISTGSALYNEVIDARGSHTNTPTQTL